MIEIASRRLVHAGVARHPRDAWIAQQRREATPFGRRPRHRILDHDSTYGEAFARVAAATALELVRTAYRASRENAIGERFRSSVRRPCLDHLLVLGEAHPRRILREYVADFNAARSHQGL